MNPIGFTTTEKGTRFVYKFSDLRKFLTRGRSHGDVGSLLVGRDGNVLIYEVFGTIEHPSKHRSQLVISHYPPFDGELPSDEEMVNPKPTEPFIASHRLIFIDTDNKKEN